jgi:CubicO group peptidase (beta-lactamase class C family)
MKWKAKLISLFALLLIAGIADLSFASGKSNKIDELLNAYSKLNKLNGSVLVAEEGKIIYEKGFGYANFEWQIKNTPETKFRIASISKTFTAVLIMKAVEEGKLSLDTKLSDVLTWYRKDTGERITIRHLLNHSSGIPNYFIVNGMKGPLDFASKTGIEKINFLQFGKNFCQGDLEFEPGSKWRYNNSGYFLLGLIVEQVYGKPFYQALEEKILIPAKMKNSGDESADPLKIIPNFAGGYMKQNGKYVHQSYWNMSTAFAAGSIYSTVKDLFMFDQALYNENFLKKKTQEQMLEFYFPNWGLGWELRNAAIGKNNENKKIQTHEGFLYAWHTRIYRIVEDNKVVMILSNGGDSPLEMMFKGITDILYGRVPAMPKQSVGEVVESVLRKDGIEAALNKYKVYQAETPQKYEFGFQELNRLGYKLMGEKLLGEAVALFKLNAETYQTSDAYDSYGEGLLNYGKIEEAIKAYEKAVELDPKNQSSLDALKKLKN